MEGDYTGLKLGELLIKVGILKMQELEDAINMANETGMPIGRVLIMSGYLTDQELQAAVQAQSLIKDKVVSIELALKALAGVSQEGITLEQALRTLGWTSGKPVSTAKLGELLMAAELVTTQQLDEALKTSQETGLPLGRVLVLTQAISDDMLNSALTAQVLIRDGRITKDQALQGLKMTRRKRVNIEEALEELGFWRAPLKVAVKLGEMFVLAGLVNEGDLMTALELGLVRETPLGQVLVQAGLVTRPVLDAALKLQHMVAQGALSSLQAAEALRQVATKGTSISQAVAELGLLRSDPSETIRLGELLKAAGVVSEEDIDKAVDLSTKNSALVGKMLLVTGMIDEPLLHAALRCQFLLREGFLKMDQAVVALNHCQRHKTSFDDALQQLGLTHTTRMKQE